MQRALARSIAPLLILTLFAPATAHEFWIAPERSVLAPGDPITADLSVGLMLRGEPYPYLSDRFARFTVTAAGETTGVSGFEGDLPALRGFPAKPGLNVIAHQTVAFRATYDDWAVFQKYLTDEGLDAFADLHLARGLPETGFAERYTRYAKALVQAGPPRQGDQHTPLGLDFELVATANPYSSGLEELMVTLLWHGAPVSDHQITVLADDGVDVTRSTVRTDQSGTVTITLRPGCSYLLNAVRLDPVDSDSVVWHSHWASMTFGAGVDGNE